MAKQRVNVKFPTQTRPDEEVDHRTLHIRVGKDSKTKKFAREEKHDFPRDATDWSFQASDLDSIELELQDIAKDGSVVGDESPVAEFRVGHGDSLPDDFDGGGMSVMVEPWVAPAAVVVQQPGPSSIERSSDR